MSTNDSSSLSLSSSSSSSSSSFSPFEGSNIPSIQNVLSALSSALPYPTPVTPSLPLFPSINAYFEGRSKITNILDIDPSEIARQITIEDSRSFRCVSIFDLMDKKAAQTPESSVAQSIARFNHISVFFATSVLREASIKRRAQVMEASIKRRAQVMEAVIAVCVRFRALQNFQGVMACIGALKTAAVYRLKRTWGAVSRTRRRQFDEISEVMSHSHNSKTYRELLSNIHPPVVPFLGIYLTDLTFIEDGNESGRSGFVNFGKRRLLSNVLEEIKQFQQVSYSITEAKDILDFINSFETMDDEEQYALSLKIEPRLR